MMKFQRYPAAVVAGKIRSCPKKVLAQKQILHAVRIEIANVDGEHRSDLGLWRQRHPVKMRAAIEQYA